jgi:hypothetical protein
MNFPHSKKTTEKWQKTLMFAFRMQMMKKTAAQPATEEKERTRDQPT